MFHISAMLIRFEIINAFGKTSITTSFHIHNITGPIDKFALLFEIIIRHPASVRFLQWVFDPNPNDTTYQVDFAILLRNKTGNAHVAHDRHILGLFTRARWMRMLRDVGLKPVVIRDEKVRELFFARRRDV